jgi:hypothetical protein
VCGFFFHAERVAREDAKNRSESASRKSECEDKKTRTRSSKALKGWRNRLGIPGCLKQSEKFLDSHSGMADERAKSTHR